MEDLSAEWGSDANSAVQISLVAPGASGLQTLSTFNPKMTYSIFGDAETIFGYQGLKINLKYSSADMRPGLQVTYNKKFKAVGETEADDLKAILEDFLPKTAFEKSALFEKAVERDQGRAAWTPPGKLCDTIQSKDTTYEIWTGNLDDPAVQQMIRRIQILIPLFIEGGTILDMEDDTILDRWTVFFLYSKNPSPAKGVSEYSFVGFATVFRYYFYHPSGKTADTELNWDVEDMEISDLPCRSRISQFLILPPHHGRGVGSLFYNSIFRHYLNSPPTIEITVEDPNEAFDDLRDINDLAYLRQVSEFTAIRINTSCNPLPDAPLPADLLPRDEIASVRKSTKIAPRQFARVLEMQLLSLIPSCLRLALPNEEHDDKSTLGKDLKEKEKEYRLWKLLVKRRVFEHNRDILMQLDDKRERLEKLEIQVATVELDYARLLRSGRERQTGKPASDDGEGDAEGNTIAEAAEDDQEDDDTPASDPKGKSRQVGYGDVNANANGKRSASRSSSPSKSSAKRSRKDL